MKTLPVRIGPGQDLRRAIEEVVCAKGFRAAFILSGIGSLAPAFVRLAGAEQAHPIQGELELLTLSGTIAPNGSHLHAALANFRGEVLGGHLGHGCIVRTTAEVLLLLLHDWTFSREPDPMSGYHELVVEPKFPERAA